MNIFSLRKGEKLTKEQRRLLERQKRERRKLTRQLKREASMYANVIRRRLTGMNLCYRYKTKENELWERGIQEVQFRNPLYASPEAIYLPIDTMRLPRGLNKDMLAQDHVVADLSINCRRQVYAEQNARSGFWFIVERSIGVRGIPTRVNYADMLAAMPERAGPLAIPVGMKANSKAVFADITNMPHAIVAGATDQGKSVFLNNIICTIAQRNTPSDVLMYMVDLKGGVELAVFEDLPHLARPIIKEEGEVIEVLDELLTMVHQRMARFEGHCRSIREWNHGNRQRGRLPLILFVVDEMANLMLNKDYRKDAEAKLAKLAATSRAAGVYCVVCTQRPSTDVITGIIKANFPVRFAFSAASDVDSRVIINSSEAYGLRPQGRMIYAHGKDKDEIQGPLVTTGMVKKIVKALKEGRIEEARLKHDVTPDELFTYALEHLNGDFGFRALYRAFRKRGITQEEVKAIGRRFEGQTIEVNGQYYRLEPSEGRRPRRLEATCEL